MMTLILTPTSTRSPAAMLLSYAKATTDAGFKLAANGDIFLRLGARYYKYLRSGEAKTSRAIDGVAVYLQEVEKGEAK